MMISKQGIEQTRVDVATVISNVGDVQTEVDAIDGSSIPTMVGTDGAFLATPGGRILCSMDFWSDVGISVIVTGSQSTVTAGFNNVEVADLPNGMTVVRSIAMMKFRMVENTHGGVNKLDATSALPIRLDNVANDGMADCLDFGDDLFTLADSVREGGDVIIGDIDVKARVDGNDTYDFQWYNAKADQNNIVFYDVQMGLRIWFKL